MKNKIVKINLSKSKIKNFNSKKILIKLRVMINFSGLILNQSKLLNYKIYNLFEKNRKNIM
jgi:hypothetical protein